MKPARETKRLKCKMRTGSEYKIPFQGYTIQYSSFYIIYGREINNLTRVKIRPTGVESKNNKGALKTAWKLLIQDGLQRKTLNIQRQH